MVLVCLLCRLLVALLAEGVDRNIVNAPDVEVVLPSPSSRRAWIEIKSATAALPKLMSPSSRRAWIEIMHGATKPFLKKVALLAEGVDRNLFNITGQVNETSQVALLAEGVDRNVVRVVYCCVSKSRPPRGGRG